MLPLLGFFLLGLSALLLVLALAVRFAGEAKPLNMVDYSRVSDARALHRDVGNRMLLLPWFTAMTGIAALHSGQAFLVVSVMCAIWIFVTFVVVLNVASRHQRSV